MKNTSRLKADNIIVNALNCKYVLLYGTIVKRQEYYGFAVQYEDMTRLEYEEALFKRRQMIIPMSRVKTINAPQYKNALTFNHYNNGVGDAKYAISFIINEDTLSNNLVPEILRQYGCLRLLNARGECLYSYDAGFSDLQAYVRMQSGNCQYTVEYGLCNIAYSQRLRPLYIIICGYCLAVLLIVMVCSVYSTMKMQRVQREYADFLDVIGVNYDKTHMMHDLQANIRETIRGIVLHAGKLEESLRQTRLRYMDNAVAGLLSGLDMDIDEAERLLSGERVFFGEYVVLRFYIVDQDATTVEMAERLSRRAVELFKQYAPYAYVCGMKSGAVVMPTQKNADAVLRRILTEISASASPVRAAVSAPHQGIEALCIAYGEVKTVLRNAHMFMIHQDALMTFQSEPEAIKRNQDFEMDTDKLERLLLSGQEEDLRAYIRRLMDAMNAESIARPRRLSAFYYRILGVYESILRAFGDEATLREFDPEAPQSQICAYLTDMALEIFSKAANRREDSRLHADLIRYLQAHSFDSDMSLTNVAQAFELSEAYVSRIIRKKTGATFGKFVENLRMSQAESLLTETRKTIADIALELGYENENTFFKAFKRRFGISPGAYRDSPGDASHTANDA